MYVHLDRVDVERECFAEAEHSVLGVFSAPAAVRG
jgi:hypothetical protein